MAAAPYAPRGVEMAYERAGPMTKGKLCEAGGVELRARYQTINLHLYLFTPSRATETMALCVSYWADYTAKTSRNLLGGVNVEWN